MKSCERSITKLFLENIETLKPMQDTQVLPGTNRKELDKNKQDASDMLSATNNTNSSGQGERAARLLKKASLTPQTWGTLYQVIEDFRNDVAKRDKFNSDSDFI